MALTYDQINAITIKKYMPKLYDNIFDSNPLLMRLRKKSYEKVDGGTSLMVPLNYAVPGASGWYSGNDTLNTTDTDVITSAEYTWKSLYVSIPILRSDELKNSGDAAMLNFVKSKMKIAEKQMLDLLGTGIYSNATNAKSIVGIRYWMSNSNTNGGISASDYTWWRPAGLDTTSTSTTLALMQTLYNGVTIDNNRPTIISTTRSLYNVYVGLLQPQQRFTDSETANAGFMNLLYQGTPVVADSHAPANHMFFLNENFIHMWAHKDEDMRFTGWKVPVNQNLKVAQILWFGSFGTSNMRLQTAATALTS